MSHSIKLTKTIPSVRNSISRLPLRRGLPRKQQPPRTQAMWIIRGFLFLPLALALAWLALSPTARAQTCREGCDSSNSNTFLGEDALLNNGGINNTAIGDSALVFNTSGINNTATGFGALFSNTSGSNNTANGASTLVSNTTGSENTANGVEALIFNATGKASEAILALQPVTFHYKHELDPEGIPQFGLVAEQVEKVNPDLVTRDADGKVYTVRYEAVN